MPERGVSKQQWLAYYDVREDASQMGWTEEEQAAIVAALDGAGGHAVLRIAPDKLTAPWPKYDSLKVQGQRTAEKVAEKIAETVLELGLDPASVIAYEQENLNRSEVVNALTALSPAVAEAEEELVAN
jgi:serine/threonine protein phosphatase PrpC